MLDVESGAVHSLDKQAYDVVHALENNIPVANKRDSQDFYDGSYSDLLNVDAKCGDIVDKFGNVLGRHKGLHNYTIGQRKGVGIAYSEPLYVTEIDAKNNIVYLGTKDELGHCIGKQYRASLSIEDRGFAEGIMKKLGINGKMEV